VLGPRRNCLGPFFQMIDPVILGFVVVIILCFALLYAEDKNPTLWS